MLELGSLLQGTAFPEEYQGKSQEQIPFYKVSDFELPFNARYLTQHNNAVDQDTRKTLHGTLIPKGAVVFAKVGAALLLNRRRITTRECLVDNNCAAIVPANDIDEQFLYQLLCSIDFGRYVQIGAIPSINRSVLAEIVVTVPVSKAEQTAIADILATVDRAIEQTEALIAKQRRIKAGLLHDLLTRAIDEHGHLRDPSTHRFKPSPVGLVPEEWEVVPLGNVAEIGSGVTLGRMVSGADTIELPYLRVANVQDGYIDLSEVKTVRIYRHELARFLLEPGDVLMNEGGDYDKLGRGTVWKGQISPCLHQNHVFRVRVNQATLLPDFLALVSASPYGKRFFVLSSKQSTNLASINSTQLKAFPIPLPSIHEQAKLIEILSTSDAVLETEADGLSKLHRLKTGLMQDLLSGRVSVVGLVA